MDAIMIACPGKEKRDASSFKISILKYYLYFACKTHININATF